MVVDMLPTRHVCVLSAQAVRQVVWAQLTILFPDASYSFSLTLAMGLETDSQPAQLLTGCSAKGVRYSQGARRSAHALLSCKC